MTQGHAHSTAGPFRTVVVVGLGGDLVVLQVLLAVEGHLLGLDLRQTGGWEGGGGRVRVRRQDQVGVRCGTAEPGMMLHLLRQGLPLEWRSDTAAPHQHAAAHCAAACWAPLLPLAWQARAGPGVGGQQHHSTACPSPALPTWRFFTSTLLPHSTMGMFSHTLRADGRQAGMQHQSGWRQRLGHGRGKMSAVPCHPCPASLTSQARSPAQVAVPGGHVLVCEARGHVKHDDGALRGGRGRAAGQGQ